MSQQTSVNVDQLAAFHHLGTQKSVYRYKYSWLEDLGLLVVNSIFGLGLGIAAFFLFRTSVMWLMILGGLIACIGLILILSAIAFSWTLLSRIGRQKDVCIYDQGLLDHEGKNYEVIRWDQIALVWRGRDDASQTKTGPIVDAIQRVDGRRFNFNIEGKLERLNEFSQAIEQEATPYLLPQAQAAFNAGQPVMLGKMSLDISGVSTGKKTVMWSELESIRVDSPSGYVVLQKPGEERHWAEMPFRDTPNILILEAVLNSAFAGRITFRFGMYTFHQTLLNSFPPEVQQLIANHQLGNPIKRYKSITILGQYRDPYAILCTDGVAFVSRDNAIAIRWDQIPFVWQKVNRKSFTSTSTVKTRNPTTGKVSYHTVSTTSYYYTYSCAIQKADGTQCEFERAGGLEKLIEQEVAHCLLPAARATFSAGRPVVFGAMALDLSGVSIDGKAIAWNELESIEIDAHRGTIAFRKQKKFWDWASLSFSDVPNIMVFEDLVNSQLPSKCDNKARTRRTYRPADSFVKR